MEKSFLVIFFSMIPLATEWLGLYPFEGLRTYLYGIVLLLNALTYHFLQSEVVKVSGSQSYIAKQIGHDYKGKLSILAYCLATILSFRLTVFAYLIYLAVTIL